MKERLDDPREMRLAIDASMFARFLDDDVFPNASVLIYAADSAARHQGWSGEDRMTAIAYMALQRVEELTRLALHQANTTPRTYVVAKGVLDEG